MVRTPTGVLLIDSDDPNTEVVVKKNGTVVIGRTRERELVLAVGEYTVELAEASGITLAGFSRGTSLNVYTGAGRVGAVPAPVGG